MKAHFFGKSAVRCCDLPREDRIHSFDAIEAERPCSSQTDWIVRLGSTLDWKAQVPDGATMLHVCTSEPEKVWVGGSRNWSQSRPVFDSIEVRFEPTGRISLLTANRDPASFRTDMISIPIPAGSTFAHLRSTAAALHSHCINVVTA